MQRTRAFRVPEFRIQRVSTSRYPIQIVLTGATPSTTTYQYSADHLLPDSALATASTGETASVVFTASADERILHGDIDDGSNGSVDRTLDRTYDENRRMLTGTDRTNGQLTRRWLTMYNSRGLPTRATQANQEGGLDDRVYTSTFDSRGMRTMRDVTSPSGEYTSTYRETFKTTCSAARTTSPSPPARAAILARFRRDPSSDPLYIAPR